MKKSLTVAVVAATCCLALVGGRAQLIDDAGPLAGWEPGSGEMEAVCGGTVQAVSRPRPGIRQGDLESALAAGSGDVAPILREIEALAGQPLKDRLEPYRQAIEDVTPALRSLEARGDTHRYSALAGSVIAVWSEMLGIYHEAALGSALRHQLLAKYPAALDGAPCLQRRDPMSGTQVAVVD